MDIEDVKQRIQAFAEKHRFVQQKDIDRIERAEFDVMNYYKMSGKKYICLEEWIHHTIINVGQIVIQVDKDDEGDEEYYSIEYGTLFRIYVSNFQSVDALFATLVERCISDNLIAE